MAFLYDEAFPPHVCRSFTTLAQMATAESRFLFVLRFSLDKTPFTESAMFAPLLIVADLAELIA